MATKRITDEDDREVITRGIVAFSALLHAWVVEHEEEVKVRTQELRALGIGVRLSTRRGRATPKGGRS